VVVVVVVVVVARRLGLMDNESSTGSCVIEIGDDEGRFFLMYKEEPQESEIMIVDMLLDHFGRRQVTTFQLKCIHENMDSLPRIFSPGALQRFLERTTMLKNLKLKKSCVSTVTRALSLDIFHVT
jgi:hypothetical protein